MFALISVNEYLKDIREKSYIMFGIWVITLKEPVYRSIFAITGTDKGYYSPEIRIYNVDCHIFKLRISLKLTSARVRNMSKFYFYCKDINICRSHIMTVIKS